MATIDFSSFSSNQSEALAQFKEQYGRSPTGDEVAQWRALHATAASGASGDESDPVTPQVLAGVDMAVGEIPAYDPANVGADYAPGVIPGEAERQAVDSAAADSELDALSGFVEGLRANNADWLAGKVSGDVADQVRAQSAQNARAGGAGAGSQAARNLQARDLGLTSMQIQEKGIAQQGQIASLQQGVASLRENRFQYMQNLREQQHQFSSQYGASAASQQEQFKQFGATFGLNKAQLEEQSRQFGASFADQAYRTQLAYKELLLKQDAFNAEQNMKIVDLISSAAMAMTNQQVTAASNNVNDAGITTTFNTLQAQLQSLLQSINTQS